MAFESLSMKMETPDLPDSLSEDIMQKFESGNDLEMMSNNEIFSQHNMFMGDHDEESEPDDVIIVHMDIREPLKKLRTLLEQKIGVDLKKYEFWLQDAQMLEPQKNLVDQCVKGEGLVQINAQIQTIGERINIVDVLKPTEAALAALEMNKDSDGRFETDNDDTATGYDESTNSKAESVESESDKDDHVINWVLDNKFKKDQARLKVPDDPVEWTSAQVKHWLQWAVRQFNLTQIKLNDWNITGEELCSMTLDEFQKKVPNDPGNVFWTHLELLRKYKFVAIIQKFVEGDENKLNAMAKAILKKNPRAIRKPNQTFKPEVTVGTFNGHESVGNRTGNNGQIQLWQFLLDILTDREHKSIIQWQGSEGEFKLTDPERVAQLWGIRKNKPAMNYEKLSRALRYYYDGDMISKVHGKRFVYKFVCDLKQLIGYDAQELASLVNECEPNPHYDNYFAS